MDGEHERLCAMKRCLGSGRISPPAGFEHATPWSEVGSANSSATRTLQILERMYVKFLFFFFFKAIIRQLHTGYSKLKRLRQKIDSENSPYCLCGRPESVTHYLEDCENYKDIRERCSTELFQTTGIYS